MNVATPASYRVLVLGTGFARRVQIPVFAAHPRFEMAAVCSRDPARAEAVAREFSIPRHGASWREMVVDPGVDLVSVVSEVAEHETQATAALEAGKHLLLEKPPAVDLAAAERIVRAAGNGRVAAINHEFRFRPEFLTLRRMLGEGALGALRGIEVRTFLPFWADREAPTHGWLSLAERGGGLLGALGSHQVDAVRFLTGSNVTSVLGEGWTVLPARRAPDGTDRPVTADDAASFVMTLEGGVRARVDLQATLWWKENTIRVFGESGTATLGEEGLTLRAPNGTVTAVPPDPAFALSGDDPDIRKPLLARLLDHLARAMDGEPGPELATLEDGLATMRVLDAVRRRGGR